MNRWFLRCALVSGLLLVLSGCGQYSVTFEVSEVINTDLAQPDNDRTSDMLDVDVVCLTKKEAEKFPNVVNGSMRADAWFAARDRDELGVIDRGHIYALRRGEREDRHDTLVGPPLLSGRVMEKGASWKREVKVQHAQSLSGESAIVIYAKFHEGSAVARVAPLVVKPPPRWQKNIVVKVGRTNLTLAE
ncbi:MAG: hypothetical protein KKB50_18925 [Planctomycetes bacterium]|nr:hypothetical protein [Planctomycetota bacterium]